MTRLYADPAHVRRHDDAPAQFLWRNRLYLVREVVAHWVESGRWWRAAAAMALSAGESGSVPPSGPGAAPAAELVLAPIPAAPKWAQRAWGEPAPDVGAAVGPASVDDGEQEYWRVEAAAGRNADFGVYDLCFDWATGCWTVARVLD
jgi:hypothetical protein